MKPNAAGVSLLTKFFILYICSTNYYVGDWY